MSICGRPYRGTPENSRRGSEGLVITGDKERHHDSTHIASDPRLRPWARAVERDSRCRPQAEAGIPTRGGGQRDFRRDELGARPSWPSDGTRAVQAGRNFGGLGGTSCSPEVGVARGIFPASWAGLLAFFARGQAGTSDGAGSADLQVAGWWGCIRAESVACVSASVPGAAWLESDGGSTRPGRHWAAGSVAA